jgi:mRNA interferase RelE/StbE
MKYKVTYTDTAIENLLKLDKPIRIRIAKWITKNLEDTEFPTAYGKPLIGNYKGFWRYRIGDYRVIAEIIDDIVTISIVAAGHRKNIYRTKIE